MYLVNIIFFVILGFMSYFTFIHLILWFETKNKVKKTKVDEKNLPSVSILIPAYNEEKTIKGVLNNLLNLNYPKDKLEIIVIDDGSKDKTYEIAKEFESKIVKVLTKLNSGKASSLNFGINYAKNELIAVVDADSFLDKDALRNCIKYFNGKNVASVTAHILVKRMKTIWEKLQSIEWMVVSVMRKAQEGINIISATPGPLSIYRKDVLIKVGKFDERCLVEDCEIAWRLLNKGYKIKMAFDSMVYSIYPDNFKNWWGQRLRWGIGGIQNLTKYFTTMFNKKTYGVGSFLVPASFLGYSFSLIGTSAFGYLLFTRIFSYILYIITSFSSGANPFSRFEFVYNINLLFVYGFIIFLVTLFVIRLSIQVHKSRPSLFVLALFLTFYPTLLTLNVLTSLYAFLKKERGWMTK